MDTALLFMMMGGSGFISFLFLVTVLVIVLVVNRRKDTPDGDGDGSSSGNESSHGGGGGGDMAKGDFTLTNYWLAVDGDSYLMDCGTVKPKKSESKSQYKKEVKLGSAPGGAKYSLIGKDGSSLKKVDAYTWDACYCEGSCRIGKDTFNLLSESNQTFMKTDAPYGLGSKGNHLVPFVSITADRSFKYGTTLFLDNLKGAKLPNGKTHNGCVRVDDNCGDGCGEKHLDLHVGTYGTYTSMKGRFQGKTNAVKSSCSVERYL